MRHQILLVSAIFCLGLAGACKPKEKIVVQKVEVPVEKIVYVDKEPTSTDAATTPAAPAPAADETIASTDIVFSGSLALSTGEESASLALTGEPAASDYALNCITFTSTPQAFRIDVTVDGEGLLVFKGMLTDFAGTAFGCFLLYKDEPQAPVIFGADASVLAGSGNIDVAISYNDGTKSAIGVIDLTKSTALQDAAVAAALATRGTTATDISALAGTYSVTCDANQAGFSCATPTGSNSVPDKLYLSPFDALGKQKLAIWKTKAAHDRCVPPSTAASDADPAFGLRIGTTMLPMNFASQDNLNTSLDAAYLTLKGSANANYKRLADTLEAQVVRQEKWRTDFCAQNPFTNANCKLMPAETDTYTYTDYATGRDKSHTVVRWVDLTAFQAATSYAGTVSTRFTACTSYWSPDKDICPSGTPTDDKGQGSYAAYFGSIAGVDTRLRLACKDPAGGYVRYQDYALADNLADAETAAKAANGCNVIVAPGSPYNNKYETFRNSIRTSFSQITATAVNFGAELCKNYAVPAAFTFKDCATSNFRQLDYVFWQPTKPSWLTAEQEEIARNQGYTYEYYYAKDRSAQELCRWQNYALPEARFPVNQVTGHVGYVAAGGGSSIGEYYGEGLCPTAFAALQASSNDYATFDANCAPEFAAMTTSQQLEAALRARIGSWDPLRLVSCSSTNATTRAEFQTGMDNTCLPQARIAMMCDNSGNCTSSLRCDGTKGGKCVDEFGAFIGRISDRIGVMDLKPGTAGAFEAGSSVSDKWVSYDTTDNKMKACTLTNDTVLNANLSDAGAGFTTFYKERVKQVCAAITDEDVFNGQSGYGGTAAGTVAGGANGGQGGVAGGTMGGQPHTTETVPDTDILKKLIFAKCANDTCS